MKNTPKEIYLNLGDLGKDELSDLNFNDLTGVTWSLEKINNTDLKFVLARRVT